LTKQEKEIAQLRAELDKWAEREAEICPEDFSFEEVITSLRSELAEVNTALATATNSIDTQDKTISQLQAAVDSASKIIGRHSDEKDASAWMDEYGGNCRSIKTDEADKVGR
jgi:chromosome segregation ATPase